ncbi:DUF4465 domain-containing protein, partial [Pontiella sp.]|uniref:DUF4465 domain-containing protein n=1 Tax=Pontiella sp. TaxID=2837462 RepID=UPI003566B487
MRNVIAATVIAGVAGLVYADQTVVDFNSLGLAADSYYRPSETDGVYADKPWSDSGAQFDFYDGEYSWSGFTYSTVNDTTTAGFGNQYAVYGDGLGLGDSGAYAVGAGALNWMDSSYDQIPQSITFGSAVSVKELYLNNTTYAALSMRDGDGFAKKFGGTTGDDADWLKLTIEGFAGASSVGEVEFYLADYRNSDNSQDYIIDDWTKVELSGLGSNV